MLKVFISVFIKIENIYIFLSKSNSQNQNFHHMSSFSYALASTIFGTIQTHNLEAFQTALKGMSYNYIKNGVFPAINPPHVEYPIWYVGNTIFHCLVRNDNHVFVSYLLFNYPDCFDETKSLQCLQIICINQSMDMLAILSTQFTKFFHNSNIENQQMFYFQNPEHMSSQFLSSLLQFGMKIESRCMMNLMFYAVENDNPKLVEILLEYGIDPNYFLHYHSFLHCVYTISVAQQLIQYGAYVNIEDCNGNLPCDIVTKNEIYEMLLSHGSKRSKPRRNGI